MIYDKPEAGKVLISEPFLDDPNFKRTVILLCEHQNTGTFGLVLNRQLEKYRLADVLPDLDGLNAPLFYGGPVETNTLHFLHTRPDLFDECTKVTEDVYWGGDFDRLRFLISTNQFDNKTIRFFVGYSGWEPDQLQEETNEKVWIITDGENNDLLTDNVDQLWRNVLSNMGGNFKVMSNFPEDPRLN